MHVKKHIKRQVVVAIIASLAVLPVIFYLLFSTILRGTFARSKLFIDAGRTVAPLYFNWKSIAQGGEETGTRMFINVMPQLKALAPRYIRIDHVYDFYHVVSRTGDGALVYDWDALDQTVCDIYALGAKPFFSLGYMPSVLSSDGTPIGEPKNWDEWSSVVQVTIERYSGIDTQLCNGGVHGSELAYIYYEVWNEPDLEAFGKWNVYGGAKDYRVLYHRASDGAAHARDVQPFRLGGPATTAAYQNWFRRFLDYVDMNNLRIDFISWHHYSRNPQDFSSDVSDINEWLPKHEYERYFNLPKILSEWGYSSDPHPNTDTQKGAAYTIAVVEKLISQKIEHAFSFEAKDGLNNNFGILTQKGEKKARYRALETLNLLSGYRLHSESQESNVQVIASKSNRTITIILVNYDDEDRIVEQVPVTIARIPRGVYDMKIDSYGGLLRSEEIVEITDQSIERELTFLPNQITTITLTPR